MKKDIEEIKAILTKTPKERTKEERELLSRWNRECTTEERESLNRWRAENLTEEEKAQLKKLVEPLGEIIEEAYQRLGIDKLPQKERSEAFLKHLKDLEAKEEELEKKEKELKAKERKLEKKTTPFIIGGDFIDTRLRKGVTTLLDLWDSIDESTKRELEKAPREIKAIIEGINLSTSKSELTLLLAGLGNRGYRTELPVEALPNVGTTQTVRYGKGNYWSEEEIPVVVITPYELTKLYKGGRTPSGKDVDNLENLLTEIEGESYFTTIIEKRKDSTGKRTLDRKREEWAPLLRYYKDTVTYKDEEKGIFLEKSILVIKLSPVYISQLKIDATGKVTGKFIGMPEDWRERVITAYGSQRLPNELVKLKDYLAREVSSSRRKALIDLENLYQIIAPEKMNREKKRIGEIRKILDRSLEVCKEIKLLNSWDFTTGVKGQEQIVFNLPKKWE